MALCFVTLLYCAGLCSGCQRKNLSCTVLPHIGKLCYQKKTIWRYFAPKIINIGLDLSELFEHITGVRFFRRNVFTKYHIVCCQNYFLKLFFWIFTFMPAVCRLLNLVRMLWNQPLVCTYQSVCFCLCVFLLWFLLHSKLTNTALLTQKARAWGLIDII